MIKHLWNFVKYNNEKNITIKAYVYAAYYRICILIWKDKQGEKLEKILGERGEESSYTESYETYRIAKNISRHVNRIAKHTPWESKCMVRALTAQKLLEERGIETTLYLGVGTKEDGTMRAHAWLRCGEYCVTGEGNAECAVVAKYKK